MDLKIIKPSEKQIQKPLFPLALGLGKSAIKKQRQLIVDMVRSGQVDALQVAIAAKAISKVFEGDAKDPGVLNLIKEESYSQFEKIQENGKAVLFGAEVNGAELGVQYDFEQDPIWRGLQDQIKALNEMKKEHENLLKSLPEVSKISTNTEAQVKLVDPETGEEYTPRRPNRTSTTGIKISFK